LIAAFLSLSFSLNELVQQKQSTRSSAQRRWITERYEYESNKPQEQDGTES
jgi:hypothetical protein